MVATSEPVRVSDHAVLRYLERAMGCDTAWVRAHIASVCAGPAALGASCVRAEGFRFEIAGGAVITVAPDNQLPSQTARDRASRKIADGRR